MITIHKLGYKTEAQRVCERHPDLVWGVGSRRAFLRKPSLKQNLTE